MIIVQRGSIMKTAEYLDRLLLRYSGSFDIYQPYVINGKEYPAYGYFFSYIEKYILVREFNMWSTRSYEHLLFMEVEECTDNILDEAEAVISNYMEPVLVRKNKRFPEKNHMSSYLNVVIISNKALSESAAKRIRRYRFEKGYKFNIRGFSQGTIMCVSMEDSQFTSSYHGRKKKEIFSGVFTEVKEGKPGFKQVMEEKGLSPYKQEMPQQ